MRLFHKYLLKEFFFSLGLFFTVFSLLFTLILGTLNLREFLYLSPSPSVILKVYIFTFIQLLSFLLPLSAYFGLLFSFYKFKEESEFLAFFSLGYTLRDFIPVIIFFLSITFLLTFISHFYLLPKAKRAQKLSQMALLENLATKGLSAKKPTPVAENFYIYAEEVITEDSYQHLKGVFLLEKRGEKGRGIYFAEEALLDPQKGFLTLKRGSAFFQEQFKNNEIFFFQDYSLFFTPEFLKKEDYYIKRGEMTFTELKEALKASLSNKARYYRYLSEYYQRLFYSISLFPLLIQALCIGIFFKSHNRFVFFSLGVAFYLLYYFSFNFFLSLGERGKIGPLQAHLIFYTLFSLILSFEFKFFKKRGIVYR